MTFSEEATSPIWNQPSSDMDDIPANRVCWQASCHLVPLKKTHSSLGVESNRYGNWTRPCIACHDPHIQRQTNHGEYMPALTGTVTGWDKDTGTIGLSVALPDRTGNGNAVDDYMSWTIIPDTRYRNVNYKIGANTANSVTVTTPIDTNRISIGSTFGILPGRYVKDVISTPGGPKAVKLLQLEGENSFVHNDGLNEGQDSTPNGVCQVCHGIRQEGTSILRSKADGTGFDDGHETDTSQYCSTCHNHGKGLGVDCTQCHGFPPVDGSTLVFDPGSTGSATAGAHAFHATIRAIPCDDCHKGSAGYGATHNNGLTVTLGFSLFNNTFLGGSFDGQTTVNYNSSQPDTTVSNTGSKTCGNIYCHGRLPDGTLWGGGNATSPVWDGSVACGDCHRATAASYPPKGSHPKHAQQTNAGYGYDCALCHIDPAADDSLHANGKSEIIFSSDPKTSGGIYGGTPAAFDTYGTCTNVYCHSTAQSSPPGSGPIYRTTYTWGEPVSLGCGSCHGYYDGVDTPTLTSGSHAKHFEYDWGWNAECTTCHNWNNDDSPHAACHADGGFGDPQRDRHANFAIDVSFAPKYGGSYSGSSIPDTSYGDCANVYCHGTYNGSGLGATPSWGIAASGDCGTCHGASNNPDEFTASGNHERHADSDNTVNATVRAVYNRNYSCTLCHSGIIDGTGPDNYSILNTARHANGSVNWSFDTADSRLTASSSYSITSGTQPPTDGTTPRAFGTCTNIYCHSNVQPDGGVGQPDSFDTPQWGTTAGCSLRCHAPDDLSYLHGTTIASGSHAQHMAYSFSVDTVQRCTLCHKWNSSASSNDCNQCHAASERTFHVNGAVDIIFDSSSAGSSASYNGTPDPGDGYGTCSLVYCHSSGESVATLTVPVNTSPAWGTAGPLACDTCHGYPPDYTTGAPKTNSHMSAGHLVSCDNCHYTTTNNGIDITDKTLHVDKIYTLSPGLAVAFYYSFSTSGGTCDTVSCHSGTETRKWGQ